ncbi:unnamed protein product, partial [Allacma fusca]
SFSSSWHFPVPRKIRFSDENDAEKPSSINGIEVGRQFIEDDHREADFQMCKGLKS